MARARRSARVETRRVARRASRGLWVDELGVRRERVRQRRRAAAVLLLLLDRRLARGLEHLREPGLDDAEPLREVVDRPGELRVHRVVRGDQRAEVEGPHWRAHGWVRGQRREGWLEHAERVRARVRAALR